MCPCCILSRLKMDSTDLFAIGLAALVSYRTKEWTDGAIVLGTYMLAKKHQRRKHQQQQQPVRDDSPRPDFEYVERYREPAPTGGMPYFNPSAMRVPPEYAPLDAVPMQSGRTLRPAAAFAQAVMRVRARNPPVYPPIANALADRDQDYAARLAYGW